jgi:low affinity Fe/Cu permease
MPPRFSKQRLWQGAPPGTNAKEPSRRGFFMPVAIQGARVMSKNGAPHAEHHRHWWSRSFGRFASWTAHASGRSSTFFLALIIILAWGGTGPLFGYSDTWQLVINTGTTIITFLMVFVIQNSQNRESAAIQLKLDELIRAVGAARNSMLDLEEMGEDELAEIRVAFCELAERARKSGKEGLARRLETGGRGLLKPPAPDVPDEAAAKAPRSAA